MALGKRRCLWEHHTWKNPAQPSRQLAKRIMCRFHTQSVLSCNKLAIQTIKLRAYDRSKPAQLRKRICKHTRRVKMLLVWSQQGLFNSWDMFKQTTVYVWTSLPKVWTSSKVLYWHTERPYLVYARRLQAGYCLSATLYAWLHLSWEDSLPGASLRSKLR